MKQFFLQIIILVFFTLSSFSQQKVTKKIEYIKGLIALEENKRAEELLETYYTKHTEDLETNWLYAYVLHSNGKNKQSEKKFKKAILLSKNKEKILLLDYARMLYESGALKKAKEQLLSLTEYNETKVEAILMLANIAYWNGDVKKAELAITMLQEMYPGTTITDELEKNINNSTAFYIKTNFEHQSDNQPLSFFGEKVAFGKYTSWLLNPKIEVSNYNFTPTEQALIVKLSNQFYFSKLGLSTTIEAGAYKNFSGKTDWIGGVNLKQKLIKNAFINLGYNKKSLLGTLTSTTYNITQSNLYGAMEYTNKNILSLHVGYNHQYFKDNNHINSFVSWIVSKPFKIAKGSVQVGYSYVRANSKVNLYESKETRVEAEEKYTESRKIPGYYNPYFTPKNQVTNSALLILKYKPLEKLELGLKGNYSFYAKSEMPFVYLTKKEGGTENYFKKEYYKATFKPYEVTGAVSYIFSNHFNMNANYIFQETFFYNRRNVNVGLNYKF